MKKSRKIKYLHLFGGGIRNAEGLLNWVKERDDSNSHVFFFPYAESNMRRYSPQIFKYNSMLMFMPQKSFLEKFIFQYRLFKRSEHIIVHAMYFGAKTLTILMLNKKFRKKLSWIEWNGDLFLWRLPDISLKNKIKNYVNYRIRQTFTAIGTVLPCDEPFFRSEFKSDAICMNTPLGGSNRPLLIMDRLIDEKQNKPLSENKTVMIQIGHTSYQFENHVKLLMMMKRFSNKDMKLILPLTNGMQGINGQYGGYEYRRKIIGLCDEIFNGKAVPFLKDVPFENFLRYTSNVDIFICDVGRTFGLGNIIYLLYMGKKVFIPAGNPFFDFLTEKGFEIYDTNKIPEMTWEEFIKPISNVERKWIFERHNEENNKNLWNDFFEMLEETQK